MTAPAEATPDVATAEELLASAEREVPCEDPCHHHAGSGPATLLVFMRCPRCAPTDEGRVLAWCASCLAHERVLPYQCSRCRFTAAGTAFIARVQPLHPSGAGA